MARNRLCVASLAAFCFLKTSSSPCSLPVSDGLGVDAGDSRSSADGCSVMQSLDGARGEADLLEEAETGILGVNMLQGHLLVRDATDNDQEHVSLHADTNEAASPGGRNYLRGHSGFAVGQGVEQRTTVVNQSAEGNMKIASESIISNIDFKESTGVLHGNLDTDEKPVFEKALTGDRAVGTQPCRTFEPLEIRVQLDLLRTLGHFPPREHCEPKHLLSAAAAKLFSRSAAAALPSSAVSFFQTDIEVSHGKAMDTAGWKVSTCLGLYICLFLGLITMAVQPLWASTGPQPAKTSQKSRLGGGAAEALMMHVPPADEESGKQELHKAEPDVKVGPFEWLTFRQVSSLVVSWGSSSATEQFPCKNTENALCHIDRLPETGYSGESTFENALELEEMWKQDVVEHGAEANIAQTLARFIGFRDLIILLLLFVLRSFLQNVVSILLVGESLGYIHWLRDYRALHPSLTINVWEPILLAIACFSGIPLAAVLVGTASTRLLQKINHRLCGALQVAVYRKGQRLPAGCSQADLVQLLNFDIHYNIQDVARMSCTCVVSVLTIVLLVFVLLLYLDVALCVALLGLLPVLGLLLVFVCAAQRSVETVNESSNARVAALKEFIYAMRTVKCYAWEAFVQQRIQVMRSAELSALRRYYWFLGSVVGASMQVPSMLILGTLSGYCLLFGAADAESIFICLQVLSVLRLTIHRLSFASTQIVAAKPSFRRLQSFLALPEAPRTSTPSWVEAWTGPPETQALGVKGSFKWTEEGSTVLRDISLDIAPGELVAVVGGVGAGKTALLHAMLGELHPEGPCKISAPERIAYCPHAPCLIKGTIRENILLGQAYDKDRYEAAVSAAGVSSTLEGSGGSDAALSEGERAKIAMARAAYSSNTKAVLVDDPFSAVDARTANRFMEEILCGPLMWNRSRIVVVKCEPERLQQFDRVVVMEEGAVVEQGLPQEVMKSKAFQRLYSTPLEKSEGVEKLRSVPTGCSTGAGAVERVLRDGAITTESATLIDDSGIEEKSCSSSYFSSVAAYLEQGGRLSMLAVLLLLLLYCAVLLAADLILVHWTNARILGLPTLESRFLMNYAIWVTIPLVIWSCAVFIGSNFTVRVSESLHNEVLVWLLRTPTDRFFQYATLGHALKCLSADLQMVDLYTFPRFLGTVGSVCRLLIPLLFIHAVMPPIFLLGAIPLYYLAGALFAKYWRSVDFVQRLESTVRTSITDYATGVSQSRPVLRAYDYSECAARRFASLVDAQVKADLAKSLALRQWIATRLFLILSFFITCMALAGIYAPDLMGPATLGLCLTNCMLILNGLESGIETGAGAHLDFVSFASLRDCLRLPQEKQVPTENETSHCGFIVKVRREAMGILFHSRDEAGRLQVCRRGDTTPLLQEFPNGGGGLLPCAESPGGLQDLCPGCEGMESAGKEHCIVAVNDAYREAQDIADELCFGTSKEVWMEIQSKHFANGAQVMFDGLKAGYAGSPRDVLKGVSLTVEPRQHVSIVGSTGSGKSTLLLTLLRLLEPRQGRVVLGGIDVQELSLGTLRLAVALVPQIPVIFSCRLRDNLDPFGMYPDSRLWIALQAVQLENYVKTLSDGLDTCFTEGNVKLSYGQLKLLSIARAALRQPAVLMLDEAISSGDQETHDVLRSAMSTTFAHSTVLAVTRHLEAVFDFDQVVVLDRGDIIEKGPAKDLASLKHGAVARALSQTCARSVKNNAAGFPQRN